MVSPLRYPEHRTFNVRNLCHVPRLCLKHAEVAHKPVFREGHLFSQIMRIGFGGWLPFLGWGGLAKVRLFST